MPVDVTEQKSPEELTAEFKQRYSDLINENQSLAKKIKDNEQTALKLLCLLYTSPSPRD